MIAVFLGLRLFSVLGRRAEHEEESVPQRFESPENQSSGVAGQVPQNAPAVAARPAQLEGVMPAVDAVTGKLLMQSKSALALSPDGHGGTVSALNRCGCLADAAKRGIQQLAYIQVDNPLAHPL